jgi:NAD(P)-dependent dehydrogenase (short-subunit alcohol dehydrogenase family)
MHSLSGKVAIVVGASSGIGRATALLFASSGAAVVLGARRSHELVEVAREIRSLGGRADYLAGDVSDEGFSEGLVALAEQQFGGVDVAFNNAGTLGEMGSSDAVSGEGWRRTIETNLTGAFFGAKHQIRAMKRRGSGSIVFTSTFVGHTVGFPGAAAYAASKAGIVGLTQALAAELGPIGIRVNALLPGGTDTAMGRQMSSTPEQLRWVAELHALKRIASPEELAQSALFLASSASSFMTGAAMLVDGGVSINRT